MNDLRGKVALVTGGRRGIGAAITQALADAGARVFTVGRGPDNDVICDLASRVARFGLVDDVCATYGRLDILVNNAGAQHKEAASRYPLNQWDYDLELMLTAPLDLCQQAIPYMDAGGHIVNILSISSYQAGRNICGYVAAKHGLLGLTRALSLELAPAIHVNAVAPGLIETEMVQGIPSERRALLNSITPAGRFGLPWEVADAVLYLVRSTFLYGQTIFVDGGWMVKNG